MPVYSASSSGGSSSGSGGGSSFGVPRSLPSPLLINQSAAWDNANRAWYFRSHDSGTINAIRFPVGTSSGNCSVAAYTNSGSGVAGAPTGGQLATSGSTAMPAAGTAEVSLGSTVTVNLGDWLALSVDNTTAQIQRFNGTVVLEGSQGFGGYEDAAHPLPATPSINYRAGRIWSLIGVTV